MSICRCENQTCLQTLAEYLQGVMGTHCPKLGTTDSIQVLVRKGRRHPRRPLVLKLQHVSESPKERVKTWIMGSAPEFLVPR